MGAGAGWHRQVPLPQLTASRVGWAVAGGNRGFLGRRGEGVLTIGGGDSVWGVGLGS